MRNKVFVLGILLIFTTSLLAQTTKPSDSLFLQNTEKYVIGIGNDDEKMFLEVLDFLRNTSGAKVTAMCESQNIIAVTVTQNAFKSYDVLRDLLLAEHSSLLLLRKENTILINDCKDEILKQ